MRRLGLSSLLIFLILLGCIGITVAIVKIEIINSYSRSFLFQDVKFNNCSYIGFKPCKSKCPNKCDLCGEYNISLNIPYCSNTSINITKVLIVPLNTTNFCSSIHEINYRCEDLYNSLSLDHPYIQDKMGWIILLIISILVLCGTIFISFIIKIKPKDNKDYENI